MCIPLSPALPPCVWVLWYIFLAVHPKTQSYIRFHPSAHNLCPFNIADSRGKINSEIICICRSPPKSVDPLENESHCCWMSDNVQWEKSVQTSLSLDPSVSTGWTHASVTENHVNRNVMHDNMSNQECRFAWESVCGCVHSMCTVQQLSPGHVRLRASSCHTYCTPL